MPLLCRTLGHAASSGATQFDFFTFHELSQCKRCGAPLVNRGHRGWKEMIVRPPAAAELPAGRGSVSEEPGPCGGMVDALDSKSSSSRSVGSSPTGGTKA